MRRSAVLLVTLFAMLWQSVVLARTGSPVTTSSNLEHAALHWQGEGHHHHGDGSYHLDDSTESLQHVATDHLSASLAMGAVSSHEFPHQASIAPSGRQDAVAASPTLDGLLRPPRSPA